MNKTVNWRVRPYHLMLVALLIVGMIAILAACGDDSDDNGNGNGDGEPQSNPTAEPEVVENPTIALPTLTPSLFVVTRTPRPTPTVTLIPTLPYDIIPYEGPWSLSMDLEINNGGIAIDIQEQNYVDFFQYTGGTLDLRVNLDGTVNGYGGLQPYAEDSECTIIPLNTVADPEASVDEEDEGATFPFTFTIEGNLRPEGNRMWMDIEIKPDEYLVQERYELICTDPNKAGIQEISQIWSMLGESDRLRYSIPISGELPYRLTAQENLSQRTPQHHGLLDIVLVLRKR